MEIRTFDVNAAAGRLRERKAGNGISIHIGLEFVGANSPYLDPDDLPSCPADAKAMKAIAEPILTLANGFYPKNDLLIDADASYSNVTKRINSASEVLKPGQTLLVTFSGHGTTGARGTAWCLFNAPLFEEDLRGVWPKFKAGVEILVVSDCCYSGGLPYISLRASDGEMQVMKFVELVSGDHHSPPRRVVPLDIVTVDPVPEAHVIHLLACGEREKTYTGSPYSVFTANLLAEWNDGKFSGSYSEFERALKARSKCPPTPAVVAYEPVNAMMLARGPFRP